jgi:hypothetical protein
MNVEQGEPNYQLLAAEWPDPVAEKVWRMLRTAPLNEILLLRSYTPAHSPKCFQW